MFLTLRSIAKRCVSKGEARVPECAAHPSRRRFAPPQDEGGGCCASHSIPPPLVDVRCRGSLENVRCSETSRPRPEQTLARLDLAAESLWRERLGWELRGAAAVNIKEILTA